MLAKINPLHFGVVSELLGRSGPKYRSIVDDISAISDLQGFSNIMVGYENPDLLGFQMINDLLNLNDSDRIDP